MKKEKSNEYYLLKDNEGYYLYNFEIMKSPYSNTGDIWTKMIASPDFAIWFTKKYLAEAIAKALKIEVEVVRYEDCTTSPRKSKGNGDWI